MKKQIISKLALSLGLLFAVSACGSNNAMLDNQIAGQVQASAAKFNADAPLKKENKVNKGATGDMTSAEQDKKISKALQDLKNQLGKNAPAPSSVLNIARQGLNAATSSVGLTAGQRYEKFYKPTVIKLLEDEDGKALLMTKAAADVLGFSNSGDGTQAIISSSEDKAGVAFSLLKTITDFKPAVHNDVDTILQFSDNANT